MKKVLLGLVAILLIALAIIWFVVPARVERSRNVILNPPPYQASDAARELHKRLLIADMHADTLLWDRDLLKRSDYGHVDVPRLIEGNVAVQGFTVVTKTPRDMNIDRNTGDTDNITLLAFAERWPLKAWTNLTERALYQARRLHEAAAQSDGKLTILKTKDDVAKFLERRKTGGGIVAGFLGIEGAHALSGDLNNLDRLYDAGYRMIGVAHFFDNEMGGSAHGTEKGGLTEAGRKMVERMEQKSMFVDLAHASPRVIADVLAMARRPVIVSHTGVKETCNNARNLSDEQLKGIALTGGLVGIGYWDTATCGRDARAIARGIRYAVNLIGADHVALGSDFDGSVEAPFDTTGLVQITDALLQEGFDEAQIKRIMGENVVRTLQFFLP
jgi:microsomal dipeptidase-like Zn-dependent dipeptidase